MRTNDSFYFVLEIAVVLEIVAVIVGWLIEYHSDILMILVLLILLTGVCLTYKSKW